LKITSAEFITSAALRLGGDDAGLAQGKPPAGMVGVPRDGLPQIAMAGRSNVGKSTLINALCRKKIARTSAAPGKTRLANIYRISLEGAGAPGPFALYFVDLPGYGYARGGADSAEELRAVAESYFQASGATSRATSERLRPERGAKPPSESERGWGPASAEKGGQVRRETRLMTAALLLVDSRHPGLDSDIQAAEWLDALGMERHIVATKIDKLSRAERTRNLEAIAETFGTAALPVSAERGEGLDELWRMIVRIARGAGTRA
jgi:GTP-binding protein